MTKGKPNPALERLIISFGRSPSIDFLKIYFDLKPLIFKFKGIFIVQVLSLKREL